MRPMILTLSIVGLSASFVSAQPASFKEVISGQASSTNIAPPDWTLVGDRPQDYRTAIENNSMAILASRVSQADGFGAMMQKIDAGKYTGKRVRFSASVRPDDVQKWAGLWMRVDKGNDAVAFDNMQSRSIQGSTAWKTYDVVLDVPADATSISFGTLVAGVGQVWLKHAALEVVSSDVPVTSLWKGTATLVAKPANVERP